jgi:hypothetical protein
MGITERFWGSMRSFRDAIIPTAQTEAADEKDKPPEIEPAT